MATKQIRAEIGLNLQEKEVLVALLAETTALRTAMGTLLAKLDADATVTDTNYAALCTPAAAGITE